MSTTILGECWPLQGMTVSQKMVLIALADQANDDGVCWPGVKSIGRRSCLSERAVQDALAWLEAVGLISKQYRPNTSTSYTVRPGSYDPAKAPPPRRRKRSGAPGEGGAPGADGAPPHADGAPGGADGAPPGVRQAHPNHQLNHQVTTSEPPMPAGLPAPPLDDETALQAACRATWAAYSEAYEQRHGAKPVRNAKVNANVKQLVQRLGHIEAPHVAAWFVGVNEAFVVRGMHDIGLLVARAEAYRTQWATGRAMTDTKARQLDQSQSNYSAVDEAKALVRQRRAANAQ